MSPASDTSGAPRSAYASRQDYIIITREAVEALGSWKEAGVFQHIAFRSERDGSWVATIATVAEECHLSVGTARRVLDSLRAKGWITGERAAAEDRTLRWSVVWSEDEPARKVRTPEARKVSTPPAHSEHIPEARSVRTTHLQTVETKDETPLALAAAASNAGEVDLFDQPVEETSRHTASDVVAAWHAGQRDVGAQPDRIIEAKVRGQAKSYAKTRDTAEDWQRLIAAAYEAGRHGRYNIAEFLVHGEPRQSQFVRPDPIMAMLAAAHGTAVTSQATRNGHHLTR